MFSTIAAASFNVYGVPANELAINILTPTEGQEITGDVNITFELFNETSINITSPTEGSIKEWIGNKFSLFQLNTPNQPRLKSNIDNPFVDDYAEPGELHVNKLLDMTNDWIITVILKEETNMNNQRLNLGIKQDTTNLFALQLRNGSGSIVIDRSTSGTGIPDYGFTFTNDSNFKLFTFERKAGVFRMYINNLEITLNTTDSFYTMTNDLLDNQIILGATSVGSYSGKKTKYQHLELVSGDDATTLNVSTHNSAIMTKYGIV